MFENNKWKISFQNEKNETKTLFCQPNVFSQGFNPSKEEETEIDFERDTTPQKNACKVRPKDQEWQGQERTQMVNYNRQNPVGQHQRHDDHNRRDIQNQPRNFSSQSLKGEFHNPYNFIPAIPRDVSHPDFGDHEPSGHDRYISDKFSGKLTVKMIVETPLVVLDTARVEVQGDHKKFPVRIENDKPFINPTSVKGMLRSAYEAVTNSRMSVFTKHEDKLAFRMNPKEALDFVPVRIEESSSGQKQITFYTGKFDESMPAAWLGKYGTHNSGNYNNLDTHRKKVWAYIEVWEHKIDRFNPFRNDNVFYFWNVVELQDANVASPTLVQPNRRTNWNNAQRLATPQGQWVEGFVCKTKQNIRGKHDERVFFKDTTAPTPEILSDAKWTSLKDKWRNLIENYQEEHVKEDNPPAHSGANSWSRQIKGGKSETILENGTLCYAKVREDTTGKFEVLELFPVMISRRLHQNSPNDLLDPTLKPAKSLSQLSPADRVFGWVGDGVRKNGNYRGQVRFGSVVCQTDDAIQQFKDLPLNILGQPKPQQGRFYVAETEEKGEAQSSTEKRNNEDAGYKKGRGLRGRKVYPHHASLPNDYWQNPIDVNLTTSNPKFFKEYRRPPKDGQEQRDSQNRSIQGWIKPQTEFQFDIHFTNLSEVELGVLVWLLDLNSENQNKYFHRFGGGKPLGFGSVKLGLDLMKSEIYEGKELKKRYESLDDVSMTKTDAKTCKTKFEDAVKSAYPNSNFLESFMRVCEGFTTTNLPTHYPRARQFKQDRDRNVTWLSPESPNPLPPHSEGLAYEWFVANNKTEYGGLKNAYVLKNIAEDNGLPILDHKK